MTNKKQQVKDFLKSQMESIICIFTLIGFALSGFIYINTTYAKENQVKEINTNIKKLNERLDIFIVKDTMQYKQERIWSIEDRYVDRPMPHVAKEEVRRLEREIEQSRNDIDRRSKD